MESIHPMDLELECYCLGIPMDKSRLKALEEHFLVCPPCVEQAEDLDKYIAVMRATLLRVGEG
jgi:hypothetical protein